MGRPCDVPTRGMRCPGNILLALPSKSLMYGQLSHSLGQFMRFLWNFGTWKFCKMYWSALTTTYIRKRASHSKIWHSTLHCFVWSGRSWDCKFCLLTKPDRQKWASVVDVSIVKAQCVAAHGSIVTKITASEVATPLHMMIQ